MLLSINKGFIHCFRNLILFARGNDTCIVAVMQVTQTVAQISPSCFGVADGQIQITSPLATEFSFDNGVTWQANSLGTGFVAGTYCLFPKCIGMSGM